MSETTDTGAIRDKVYSLGPHGFPLRFDLVLSNDVGFRRLAETFGEGFLKYGADNWKKGFTESNLLCHALEHIRLYLSGDRGEDHVTHAMWNLYTLTWMQEKNLKCSTSPKIMSNQIPKTTYKSYIKDALRTEADHLAAFTRIAGDPRKLRLLHAVMGIVDEAGELNKALKDHLFYGKNLDLDNLLEESGDLFWFLALMADVLGHKNFNRALQANIRKLRARYPEKFTETAAVNRDTKAEATALQGKHQFDSGHPAYGPKHCKTCGHGKESAFHIEEPF